MEFIQQFINVILHVDKYLAHIITTYGTATYAILFLVIFVETGFIVMPFLPGDSLLFAAGAFAGNDDLNLYSLLALLIIAAVTGDSVNYLVGRKLGRRAYNLSWVNQQHLDKAQHFYDKYGGKAIVLARFVPIVRSFAPFVAGIGRMSYARFISFNILGGIAWVMICVLAGYFFGQIELVRKNFELVVLAIIVISILPIIFEVLNSRRNSSNLH
jgi:membrane-associated protein